MPIEVLMPALSPTMKEGNLTKWHKKEGDPVKSGDLIAEIETDKATMEVEAVDEGVLGKILVSEGTEGVAVNELIALILEEGEDKKTLASYSSKKPAASAAKPEDKKEEKAAPQPVAQPAASPAPALAKTGRIFSSPLARRIADMEGVNLSQINGTGPRGRVIKADVLEAVSSGGTSSGVARRNPVEYTELPNNNMRKIIAKRLLESKQTIPHFYLTIDCNLDNLLAVRAQINEAAEGAYKLSVNDFVIKATALALKKIPAANATWTDAAILRYNNVDVSVAVAIDGGLITPIIRNAEQKTLPNISKEMKDLAARAKENKLAPEEFQGGGFSISNLGMYGIKQFNAIINPPQSCILAVGVGEKRPVIRDGKIEVATIMETTLSSDHRVVDGAVGAAFLAAFKTFIEQPVLMFV